MEDKDFNPEDYNEQPEPAYTEHTWEPSGQPPKRAPGHGVLVAAVIAMAVMMTVLGIILGAVLLTRTELAIPGLFDREYETDASGSGNSVIHVKQNGTGAADTLTKETGSPDAAYSTAGSAGDRAYASIAEAVAEIKDSVVEINVSTTTTSFFGVPTVSQGAGSGVILTADGYIVTNNHVIEDAEKISVTLTNGKSYAAKLVGTTELYDLAVIKIEPETELTTARLGCSGNLALGEEVIAIGNPLGSLGGTVTNGIISALQRRINIDGVVMTLLQTNAAISPGNSGGGLFNMAGELIGIVNAKNVRTDVEGIGFAIPVDIAYDVIRDLMDYGYLRGQIDHGLTLYNMTSPSSAQYYFGSRETGLYVTASKYDDVPLKRGDRIAAVGGIEISSISEFETILRNNCKVGDEVELTVRRGGETLQITITLHEYVPVNVVFED